MKKIINAAQPALRRALALTAAAALLLGSLAALTACGASEGTDRVYIYNLGEYLADGSEGIFDCISGFEEYYEELTGRGLKVYYTTFDSNEDLYAKISSGASGYDVIVPSDYMVARLIAEDLLLPIDLEATCEKYGAECYYDNIGPEFRGMYYDPEDEYSVPYTYGRVGIIYNTNYVNEEDLGGWDILWNEKYAGKILQFNSSRDGFGTVQYMLGIDVNTTDPADWELCLEKLLEQKPLIQGYVNDEVYNKMESGEAWIAPYYAGDYLFMLDVNEDLGFYYPEPTNIFVDTMCVPKGAPNREIGELFINYMLSEEPAVASAEFVKYASPNTVVRESEEYAEELGEEAMEILYPEDFDMQGEIHANAYRNLDPETLELLSSLWEELKISGGMPSHVYILAAALAVLIAAAVAFGVIKRRRRSKWW